MKANHGVLAVPIQTGCMLGSDLLRYLESLWNTWKGSTMLTINKAYEQSIESITTPLPQCRGSNL